MNTSLLKNKTTVTISLDAIPIAILFLCTALTGFLPQSILSMGVILACAAMLFQGNLYLAYPFMIFYGAIYGAVFGLSVYRIYSLAVLFGALLRLKFNPLLNVKFLMPLVVYVAYALFVIFSYSTIDAVYFILNAVCCVIVCVNYLAENPENIHRFFKIYVTVALIATFTGMIGANPNARDVLIEDTRNVYGSGTIGYISRFTATFEDPNYMGFFYTIAVFATVVLNLFKPWKRWCIVGLLYVAILYSVSMTAIVVNILLWLLYLTASGKLNLKAGVACILIMLLAISLYQYGLEKPDTPLLGNVSYRINEKIQELEAGDMAGVTTGRTDLTKEHLEYFGNLPWWKQLFGGTPVNAGYIAKDLTAAAHNEYADMLLNVGLIGTAALLYFMLSSVIRHYKQYKEMQSKEHLCLLMCKCVWLAYAATLTLFVDFRFMLPFFI